MNKDLLRKLKESIRDFQSCIDLNHAKEIFDIKSDYIFYNPFGLDNNDAQSLNLREQLCRHINSSFSELNATPLNQIGIKISF